MATLYHKGVWHTIYRLLHFMLKFWPTVSTHVLKNLITKTVPYLQFYANDCFIYFHEQSEIRSFFFKYTIHIKIYSYFFPVKLHFDKTTLHFLKADKIQICLKWFTLKIHVCFLRSMLFAYRALNVNLKAKSFLQSYEHFHRKIL